MKLERTAAVGPGLSALVALAIIPAFTAVAAGPPAELVLRGGAIHTMDKDRTRASALAVREGRIVYVGDDSGAQRHIGPETRVIRLDGRMVLPGFHDSHIHPVSGGLRLLRCNLYDLKTQEAVFARVRECAAAPSARKWLLGNGWSADAFPDGAPSRARLDELVPGRPAFIRNEDGHAAWVNSRALAIAGIDATTPDPEGGRIMRDPGTGEPAGALHGSAVNLVRRHIPPPTQQEYLEALRRTSAMANRFGITSIIDASADDTLLRIYQTADRAGTLTFRVLAAQRIDTSRGPGQVDDLIEIRNRYRGRRLRANSAKIFVDGDFKDRSAALLSPYANAQNERGKLNLETERLEAIVKRLDAEGFDIHMHALGDRAVRAGLDAIEEAIKANGPRDRRHQLAHLALVDPSDLPRFRTLGVAADFQPLWAWKDRYMTAYALPAAGPGRARRLVAISGMARSGAVIVAGSDWPSPSMSPLEAIQIAVTRRPPDGSGPPWLPQERADLPTMIKAYTVSGAWAARQEFLTGSIESGKAADLVILERDLLTVEPVELKNVRILLTLLDGQPVWRDPGFMWPDPAGGRGVPEP